MASINKLVSRRNFLKDTTVASAGAAFAAGIRPIFSNASEGNEHTSKWYGNIYCQLHLDAHFGGFDEIYKNFDAEAAAQIFNKAGFQMVSYLFTVNPTVLFNRRQNKLFIEILYLIFNIY